MDIDPSVAITGYRFRYRMQDAPSDYLPCLIGWSPRAPQNPTLTAYFETITQPFDAGLIGDMVISKWTVETGNPILGCRVGRETFYVPANDLIHIAEVSGLDLLLDRVVNLTKRAGA